MVAPVCLSQTRAWPGGDGDGDGDGPVVMLMVMLTLVAMVVAAVVLLLLLGEDPKLPGSHSAGHGLPPLLSRVCRGGGKHCN